MDSSSIMVKGGKAAKQNVKHQNLCSNNIGGNEYEENLNDYDGFHTTWWSSGS